MEMASYINHILLTIYFGFLLTNAVITGASAIYVAVLALVTASLAGMIILKPFW
jgi:hypothetical protein